MTQAQSGPAGSSKYNLPDLFTHDDDSFLVIAHRGASAYFPENTMAAFKGAVELKAEMIELDVMMSKDGVPVVFHDARLATHTTGKGLLKNHTLEELKKLDAGFWFDARFTGEQIPTLEEVLGFASGKIALNIEIKTEAVSGRIEDGIEQKSLRLVEKYDMENHVLFSSFDYRAIRRLRELNAEIPVAVLFQKNQSDGLNPSELVERYNADAFNCNHRQLSRRWMENLEANDIPVFVYTVNREERMRKLIRMGVRGIITNRPDVLLGVAATRKKKD